MAGLFAASSPDGLKGFLLVPDSYSEFYPCEDDLKKALAQNGIVYGVDEDALHLMVAGRMCNRNVLVAKGRPWQKGIAGRLKLLVDIAGVGKPQEREDGSVDHRDLKTVVNVCEGDHLVKRIPPVPGRRGRTVLGKEIVPPEPKDAKLVLGEGTKLADDDSDLLVAARDGAVVVERGGRISVKTAEVIPGDIDYATGNISFSGDLRIIGTVRAGFAAHAKGNLYVGGSVEDAEVSATGDIEIVGGAAGAGKGVVTSGGSIVLHHVEGFRLRAQKDITVAEDIVHCSVSAEGVVKARCVVGGSVAATRGVEAETIGGAAETRTLIDMGNTYLLLQHKEKKLKEIEEINGQIRACRVDVYELVRNGMGDDGVLPEDDDAGLVTLRQRKEMLVRERSDLKIEVENTDARLRETPNPVVKAGTVCPNTVLRFGLLEKLVKEKVRNVLVHVEDGRVVIDRGAGKR